MGSLIDALCAAAAFGCAVLLLGGYRRSGVRLLVWSGLCFASLTVNNLLTGVDLVLPPAGRPPSGRTSRTPSMKRGNSSKCVHCS